MLPCSLSDIVCVSETVNGQVTFRFLALRHRTYLHAVNLARTNLPMPKTPRWPGSTGSKSRHRWEKTNCPPSCRRVGKGHNAASSLV